MPNIPEQVVGNRHGIQASGYGSPARTPAQKVVPSGTKEDKTCVVLGILGELRVLFDRRTADAEPGVLILGAFVGTGGRKPGKTAPKFIVDRGTKRGTVVEGELSGSERT